MFGILQLVLIPPDDAVDIAGHCGHRRDEVETTVRYLLDRLEPAEQAAGLKHVDHITVM